MKTIKCLFLFLFLFSSHVSRAQFPNPNLDSLFRVWNDRSLHDTSRLNALNIIAFEGYLNEYPDSAFYYAQLQYEFAEARGIRKHMANALMTQGGSYEVRSDFSKALEYLQRSLIIFEEFFYRKEIANVLQRIGFIYERQGENSKALDYHQRSLMVFEEISDNQGMSSALLWMGFIYDLQGDYSRSQDCFQRTLKLYEEVSDKEGIAEVFGNIGYLYMQNDNFSKALEYYQQCIQMYEECNSKYSMTFALNNVGYIYMAQEDFPRALEYFQRSLKIKEELSDKHGIATTLIPIGLIYMQQDDYSTALEHYHRGLKICEETNNKKKEAEILMYMGHIYYYQDDYPTTLDYLHRGLKVYEEISDKEGIVDCLLNIGRFYELQGNHKESIRYYERALQISEELGSVYKQYELCEYLYNAYKDMGNGNKALEYHEKMMILTDSLNKNDLTNMLQQMEFARQSFADSLTQVAKEQEVQFAHEIEVRKKNRTKNIAFGIGLLILIVAVALYGRLRYTRRAKASIEIEKGRSDNLLLNILPAEIAAELKEKGEAAARDFDMVSVLFTDFVGFTQMSAKLSATELVAEINYCFKGFDGFCEKYGVEKIKTIGDAYMAAGGLPISSDESARETVLAALAMVDFIARRKAEREAAGQIPFEMRLGIHTGPVVAGIVGVKKFQYDIWGDTVNIASRMENSGEIGKVNISQSTYELIIDDAAFTFESRGKIEVKGKGELEMWFVKKSV